MSASADGRETAPASERQARVLLQVMAVLFLLGTAIVATAAWSVADAGLATVHVRDKTGDGDSIWIPMPMALAAAAVHMAPDDMLEGESPEDLEELQRVLPALVLALDGLETAGDFTLVEVEGPGEHVRIDKKGRSLEIRVDDAENEINLSLPIRSFARLFREVEVKARRAALAAPPSASSTDEPEVAEDDVPEATSRVY
jgi:hypothetical protein